MRNFWQPWKYISGEMIDHDVVREPLARIPYAAEHPMTILVYNDAFPAVFEMDYVSRFWIPHGHSDVKHGMAHFPYASNRELVQL
jgi:hypothetical protein